MRRRTPLGALLKKQVAETQTIAKKQADEMWDRVFTKAVNGEINKEEILAAMQLCNTIDRSIIENKNNDRNKDTN